MNLHVHLDPIGGVSGDMFVACMLDAFPEHSAAALSSAESVAGVPCRLTSHRDQVLTGARFMVEAPGGASFDQFPFEQHDTEHRHHPHRHHEHDTHHEHRAWRTIRAELEVADLPEGARSHAIGIFTVLATPRRGFTEFVRTT